MSLSPFKSDVGKPASVSHQPDTDRLTLSQALIITAGLAGLLGLCGGAAIRFSLANSSSTRFLSPLQTFPKLSTWAPVPDQNADAQNSSDGAESSDSPPIPEAIRMPVFDAMEPLSESTNERDQTVSGQPDLEGSREQAEVFDITTFDAFAARDDSRNPPPNPLETLRKGPNWGASERVQREPEAVEDNP